jgi:hypothetical protein
MTKPKKLLKDYFTEDFHTPNNKEVMEYLEENFLVGSGYWWSVSDKYITPSRRSDFNNATKFLTIDNDEGKFIDTETFKEIIGMTNTTNEMPKLIAGRHFIKFKNGGYAMVMDGYINYVRLGRFCTGLAITGFDNINLLKDVSFRGGIVEVFDPVAEYSKHFNQSDFDSGKHTVWKKQEKTQQQIEMEALGEQIAVLQKQYEALKQASE